jgi:hypothetical protein
MEFDVADIIIIIIIITKVRYWTLSEAASIQFTHLHAASVRTYLMQSPIHVTVISLQDVLQQTVQMQAM